MTDSHITLRNISRYSYFGAFRSNVANIGPYAAMLTQDGDVTDIGSYYLGGEPTGKAPDGSTGAFDGGNGSSATRPYGFLSVAFVAAVAVLVGL